MDSDRKYYSDPQFRMLVDYMENSIAQAQFTPSEMREAAMLASIHYEMRRPMPRVFMSDEDISKLLRAPSPSAGEAPPQGPMISAPAEGPAPGEGAA